MSVNSANDRLTRVFPQMCSTSEPTEHDMLVLVTLHPSRSNLTKSSLVTHYLSINPKV